MADSSLPAAPVYAREAAIRVALIGGGLLLAAAALGVGLRYQVGSGAPLMAIVGALGFLLLLAILRWPLTGVAVALFGVLLCEALPLPGDPTTEYAALLYANLKSWTPIGLALSPIDLILTVTLLAWLAHAGHRGRPLPPLGAAGWPMLLFGLCLAAGYAWGIVVNGGDSRIAFFEIRPLIYLIAVYFATGALVRTTRQATLLTWLMIAAVALSSLRDVARYLFLHAGSIDGTESIAGFAHENALFLAAMLVLLLAQFGFGRWGGQRWLLLLAAPSMALALLVSQRRAGFVVLAIGLAVWALGLFLRRRRLFWLLIPPLLLVAACYLAVFWNRPTGVLGQPVRAVQTSLGIGSITDRDDSSNRYRVIEEENIWRTIRGSPLAGVGFGRPFNEYVPLVRLGWWDFQFYTPHNQVFWIWLKTGVAGFVVMLWLFGAGLAHSLRAFALTRHATLRPLLLLAAAYTAMLLVFAYVDIGFANARPMLLLGILLGIAGNEPRLRGAPEPNRAGSTPNL
jgi:O-antigen ligase